MNSILFIEGNDGFIPKAMIKKLKETGFEVICISDSPDEIAYNRNKADMLLYYLPVENTDIKHTLTYLFDLCQNEHKTLSIAGEIHNVAKAKKLDENHFIYSAYERPVNISALVQDMIKLSNSHTEYNRTKTILIIDDDNDFLQIMEHWLGHTYNVVLVRSGTEAMNYLERTRPDLILLDYEMPELDGYQILNEIRKNPLIAQIPVVFLTGINDKDSVMRILKRKPDGYLLKSICKDELIDALDRFFANSLFLQKAQE